MKSKNKKFKIPFWLKLIAFLCCLFILMVIAAIIQVVIEYTTPKQHLCLAICFAVFIILCIFLFITIKTGLFKKIISKQSSTIPKNVFFDNTPNVQPQIAKPEISPQIKRYTLKLNDVLANIDKMSSHGLDFEEFTVQLLLDNGFENVKKTQGAGDYGIDVLASKEGITYAIQCKCYSDKVGNKAVQEAYSGKSFYNCMVAAVLTNNFFTNSAIETAKANNVLLWDRNKLIDLLKEYITKERVRQVTHHLRHMATSVKQILELHNIENTVDDIFIGTDATLINLKITDDKKRLEVSNYLEEIANYIPSSCVKIQEISPPLITLSIDNPSEMKALL